MSSNTPTAPAAPPPVDNDHVAEGATKFTEAEIAANAAPAHELSHLEEWFKTEFNDAIIHMRATMTSIEDEAKSLLAKIAAELKKA